MKVFIGRTAPTGRWIVLDTEADAHDARLAQWEVVELTDEPAQEDVLQALREAHPYVSARVSQLRLPSETSRLVERIDALVNPEGAAQHVH